jgi:Na+/H+ antiporter NhaD/arsenite permease-like protein
MTIVILLWVIFILGYLAIVFEHNIHINKAAPALLAGVLCWTVYVLNANQFVDRAEVARFTSYSESEHATEESSAAAESAGHDEAVQIREFVTEHQLSHTLFEISGVLFFLLGAMTIVEMIDAFEGFSVITTRIKATSKVRLLWIIAWLTFLMSSALDNLTSTIVMVSLVKKLVTRAENRLIYAGIIIIAANAGGAWTVIGDVTTTMLWISQKISVTTVMVRLFIPSVVCLLVPLLIVSWGMRGEVIRPDEVPGTESQPRIDQWKRTLMFGLGVLGLLFVPVFKLVTHLPPFMGMMLSLSVLWIVGERIRHTFELEINRSSTHVIEILRRVDSSSILFFLGILLCVSGLAAAGLLDALATQVDTLFNGNLNLVAMAIGLTSSIVDNVPLVAAGIQMYEFPKDHPFWQFLAYTAGTGGSCLIIGSAAGVAAMSLEKISFMWYLRRVAPLALAGFLAGAGVYIVLEPYYDHAMSLAMNLFGGTTISP